MDKKISFEVEGFDVIDDYSDNQLAIVEIYVCHDGNNLHDMPIDLSVIKKAKRTCTCFKKWWTVNEYSKWRYAKL